MNDEVHVYFFDTNRLNFQVGKHITRAESEKATRFSRETDKKNFLYGRCLIRLLLGKLNNIPPGNIEIAGKPNKKPFAKISGSGNLVQTQFTLSHSENGLLIAFSQNQVGCDVEAIRNTKYDDVVNTSFTPNEAATVRNSNDSLKDFFKIWTRKEAVLKLNGTGLIDNLKQLEVCNAINSIEAPELQSSESLFLTSFQIGASFSAAICYQGNAQKSIYFFDGSQALKNLL